MGANPNARQVAIKLMPPPPARARRRACTNLPFGRLSAPGLAGVVHHRERGAWAELRDDDVALAYLYDVLHVGIDVSMQHGEVVRMRANSFVLVERHLHRLGAVLVGTLTHPGAVE